MSPWVDDNGELTGDSCPSCEGYSQVERDLRNARTKIARLEREAERATISKRDGAIWKDTLTYWCEAFPERKITSKGIKSARAARFFQRLEAGATPEDVRYAIDGAKAWPWITFGRRTRTPTPQSKPAVDLEDVVSVGSDAQFDWLVAKGREAAREW